VTDEKENAVSTRYEPLRKLYPEALVRAGQVYPAAVARRESRWAQLLVDPSPPPPESAGSEPASIESGSSASASIESGSSASASIESAVSESALRRAGAAHLAARRADDPSLTNGPTACWQGDDRHGVRVSAGQYFDMLATCDALKAEFDQDAGATPITNLPLRALAHELAGDPLTSGRGRSAAIGISVILTIPISASTGNGSTMDDGARAFIIGCRGHVSSDRGSWHVAPSGMLELTGNPELTGDPDPIAATVATELLEELGIRIPATEVADRMLGLGLVHDLLRLKPDLVVRLDLSAAEVPAELAAVSEFSELAFIPLDRTGVETFWKEHDPEHLTPAAAGAIALLEASLAG
jgi:hypothetical protein